MSRQSDQKQFLDHVKLMIDYWENNIPEMSSKDKLEGLAFSIMTALDGCAITLPGYVVAAINEDGTVREDIAGDLHENMNN